MTKLFENTSIGNFIFLLGVESGKRNFGTPTQKGSVQTSVNLYQQTPWDSKLSDIMAMCQGKFLLIEFKRNEGEIKTEVTKATKKQFIIDLAGDKELQELSVRCHLIAYPHPNFGASAEMFFFSPYCLLQESKLSSKASTFCLNGFFHKLFDESSSLGVTYAELEKYITRMGTSPSDPVEGIVFCFDGKSSPTMYDFSSFRDLNIKLPFGAHQQLTLSETLRIGEDLRLPESGNKHAEQ
jgi:hypothetical protein